MRAWFLLFILSIGSGGFFALLVALSRTPFLERFFPPDYFYHALVGHVDLALIMGLISFLIALWHWVFEEEGGSVEKFFAYGGTLAVFITALLGLGQPVHNNYVPTIVYPTFFLGLILYLIALLLVSLRFSSYILEAFKSREAHRFFLSLSVLVSLTTVITFLLSIVRIKYMEELYLFFEKLFWLPGHVHQFLNALLLLSSWYLILKIGGKNSEVRLRYVNYLLFLFPVALAVTQLLIQDPISEEAKLITTTAYAVGIGIPTLVNAFLILSSIFREGGIYFNSLKFSIILYILGALMGYMGVGTDLRVPAHYHTVIASILLSIMILTYHLLKELGYRSGELPKLVRLQPYLYGSGMFFFVMGLFWAGVLGAPRKTPGVGYIDSPLLLIYMLIMGLGSILSVLGGIIFVLYSLYSVIRRWKYGRSSAQG